MRYIKSFDGLRALAVIAVLFYHGGMPYSLGGFQGVTVFFVLSGYLITSLLIAEHEQNGRIHLGRFWYRRAKRLLPPLVVVLVLLNVLVPLFDPSSAERLRTDTITSLFYVTNWGFIFQDLSYFESFETTNYLTHFWSLAIEEQYYVFWALLVAVLLPKRNGRRLLVRIAFWGALLSACGMFFLFHPEQDPSRVYYGTDTRLFSLLIGSLFAFAVPIHRLKTNMGGRAKRLLSMVATLSLVIFAAFVGFTHAYTSFTYRGGTVMLSIVTACWVVTLASHNRTWVDRVLSGRILRWMGTRSYGIYLYHYPLFLLGGSEWSWISFLLLAAATFLVAEASYRWVETPVRTGKFAFRKVVAATVVSLSALLLIPLPHPPASIEGPLPPLGVSPLPAYAEVVANEAETKEYRAVPVTLIGDSVSVDPAPALEKAIPGIVVDAEVGRQMWDIAEVVKRLKRAGSLGEKVVIELGSNGSFTQQSLNRALEEIGEDHKVYLVNARVPRPWQGVVNESLAKTAKKHPNVYLIDWHRYSKKKKVFREDEVHLTPEGGQVYAAFIADQLKKR